MAALPVTETQMTMGDVRDVLSQTIRGLQQKDMTAGNANAICNVVGKLLSSVKLELEYQRLTGQTPNIAMLQSQPPPPPPLPRSMLESVR